MYQIVVPIDPSEYTKTSLLYASRIASMDQVSLTGIAIIDNLNIEEAVLTFVPLPQGNAAHLEEEMALLEEANRKAKAELDDFRVFCQSEGLNCHTQQVVGRPDFVIESAGKYADLIITGMRNFFHFETSKTPEKTALKIITQLQTPILLVPKKFKPVTNVLIAFDGSYPALRAAKEFVNIEWDKEYNITLLVSQAGKTDGNELLEKMENYLSTRTNNKIHKILTNNNIIKTFDEDFLDKIDMVVCGMHSQNIFQKLFVGSFPEHLINLNRIPVLIAQ